MIAPAVQGKPKYGGVWTTALVSTPVQFDAHTALAANVWHKGVSERILGILLHVRRDIVFGQHRRIPMEVRVRLECEVIDRQMRRRHCQRGGNVGARLLRALARQPVHQIEIEVVEILARDVDGAARLVLIVDAAERLEVRSVETLDADRQAVDAGRAVGTEFFSFEGAGVGFERDFRVDRQRQPRAHRGDEMIAIDTLNRRLSGGIDLSHDHGVGIVGNSIKSVFDARRNLKAQWRDAPGSRTTSDETIRDYLAHVRDPANKGVVGRNTGDANSAIAGAAKVLSDDFTTDYIYHAQMEPHNCLAWVKGDSVEIWSGSQWPSRAREDAAKAAGVAPERVTVHQMQMGGGFGRRAYVEYVVDAVLLSKAAGKPVKMIQSREDDVTHARMRPMTAQRIEIGIDAAGKPVASVCHGVEIPAYAGCLRGRRIGDHDRRRRGILGRRRSVAGLRDGLSRGNDVLRRRVGRVAAAERRLDRRQIRIHCSTPRRPRPDQPAPRQAPCRARRTGCRSRRHSRAG